MDEYLADPAATHGDALLAQMSDQAIQRPGRERQAQLRWPGQRGVDHGAALLSGVGRWPPAAYVLFQPLQPACVEALEPMSHGHSAQIHTDADGRNFQAIERMQDDLSTPHEAGAYRARPRHPAQLLPFFITHRTHTQGHGRVPPQSATIP